MKSFLHSFLPQWFINIFWHLPKAILANIVYGFPTRGLKVIGVTGTDGKTTTTNMIYQILKAAGKKVSMVSSINATIAGKDYDTGFHVSSPDPFTVQKYAKEALEHKDEYLILEVTSHGLDQYRFWGINFTVGVITNITHDHLDYHKTFKKYQDVKLMIMRNAKYAVVNENVIPARAPTEGREGIYTNNWILGTQVRDDKKLVTFGVRKGDFNQKEAKLKLKIPGEYNIENALASLATAFVIGIDKKMTREVLEDFSNLKGRMEEVKNTKGFRIMIDFASTPNSLEQALKALRKQTKGRLISVFGSASQRDILKRPMMGKISAQIADITIITDEDPRYEDRNKIIKEIADGAQSVGAKIGINLFKEPDREKAIKLAISLAKRGDTVGIFGKGHEKSINYKGTETPWSDFEAVKKAL